MSRVIDEHREYLSDGHRVEAYRVALQRVVSPGSVVVDLGAGTGVLGLLACQAGARRVYAIDEGSIVGLARDIARAGPYADRIVHIRGLSTFVSLPEPADVVVTDQIGNFGFEAGAFEYLPDARRRFLRPGGVTVPDRLAIILAPCEHAEARGWVDFWARPVADVDVSCVLPLAASTGYPVQLEPAHLLAPGSTVSDCVIAAWAGERLCGAMSWTIERDGTLHGLGGWFRAVLAPGIELTNAPGAPARIRRRNVFLPVDPLRVHPGDRVEGRVTILPASAMVDWSVAVRSDQGELRSLSRHSTFNGMLVSAEDLARTSPAARPELSRAGQARRLVLNLCDGCHAVAEIERELANQFPDLFSTAADAAAFVAEVLVPYGR